MERLTLRAGLAAREEGTVRVALRSIPFDSGVGYGGVKLDRINRLRCTMFLTGEGRR